MKLSKLLIVFGVILLSVGLILALTGVIHSPSNRTFSIPAGQYYYNYHSESLSAGQTVQMDFTVTGTSTVDVFIFNEAQWNDYSYDGSSASLASASGSQGSVSLKVETGGTYYLVLDHGSGFDGSAQEGSTTTTITGTYVPSVILGTAILVVGILLSVGGSLLRRKETAAAKDLWQQQEQAAGVVYYQNQQPPNQPPAQPPKL